MIKNYNSKYDKQILNLWNQQLYRDQLNLRQFYKYIILDENFDPELMLLSLDNNQLNGFIYATKRKVPYENRGLEQNKGWIVSIAVVEEKQKNGIGTLLLEEVENRLRKKGVSQIVLASYSPNYFFPGVDMEAYMHAIPFFEKFGYQFNEHHAVSMCKILNHYKMPEKYVQKEIELLKSGYHIRNFKLSDSAELILFLQTSFSGGWAKGVRLAINEGRAEKQVLVCTNKNGEIVGFVQHAMDGNQERFGPFGVREDLRGLGIGSLLFHRMMNHLCQNKIYYTYFVWTSGSNIQKYQSWGMEVYRTYKLGSKMY